MTDYPPGLPGRKKNIEWSQESLNWMSGCEGPEGDGVHCKGCYAKPIATRLKGRFGYPKDEPFSVVFHPDKLDIPFKRKAPRVFFSVSMGDWMYAESNWRREALRIMKACPRHIFVTLTKQYDDMWKIQADSPQSEAGLQWGREIPRNVIVGISVTKKDQIHGIDELRKVPALVRLVCFEPLLEDLSEDVSLNSIDWIIIGKRTKQRGIPEFTPEKVWVDALITKAREQEIPVFIKPNLHQLYPEPIEETPYNYIRTTMLAEEEGSGEIIKYETYLEHQNKAIKKALMEDE